jgi:hypothetical protein
LKLIRLSNANFLFFEKDIYKKVSSSLNGFNLVDVAFLEKNKIAGVSFSALKTAS